MQRYTHTILHVTSSGVEMCASGSQNVHAMSNNGYYLANFVILSASLINFKLIMDSNKLVHKSASCTYLKRCQFIQTLLKLFFGDVG